MPPREKHFCHFCGHPLALKLAEGRERLWCESCQAPLYENPVPATALVVVDESERICFVKRGVEPHKGGWCLPGGFIEIGESPEEGALRELLEETSLEGRIGDLLGVTVSRTFANNCVLLVGYLVRDYAGTPAAGDDATDIGFFAEEDFPEIVFESHKRFVRIYQAGFKEK